MHSTVWVCLSQSQPHLISKPEEVLRGTILSLAKKRESQRLEMHDLMVLHCQKN